MEKTKFLPFPKSENEETFPPVPWDDSMLVQLDVEAADTATMRPPQQPSIKKLDIKMNVKPTGAPIKQKASNKPKKSGIFGGLGF